MKYFPVLLAAGGRPRALLSVNQFLLIGSCHLSSRSILLPMMLRLIEVLMVIVILREIEGGINGKGTGSIVMSSQGLPTVVNELNLF